MLYASLTGIAFGSGCIDRALTRLLIEGDKEDLMLALISDIETGKLGVEKLKSLEGEIRQATRAGDSIKVESLKAQHEATKISLLDMNDEFILRTSKLLDLEGVPNTLYTEKGMLILKLDLEAPPTSNQAFNFYRKAREKFGVGKITVSFGQNAPRGRMGFYRGSEGRIEIGFKEVVNLLEGKVGVTPRHEIRHAIFGRKEAEEIPSAFQVKFRASPEGNLLNTKQRYDKYMSTEEIYTWSTDFQSLARLLRSSPNEAQVIADITAKAKKFGPITETAQEIPEVMSRRLREMMEQKNFQGMEFRDDAYMVIRDELGRSAEIGFFGKERKALFQEARALQERLTAGGAGFENSLEGLRLSQELSQKKVILANYALDRLGDLRTIAVRQQKELKALTNLLDEYPHVTSEKKSALVQSIREQLHVLGNNVKEGYKGSVLKSSSTTD